MQKIVILGLLLSVAGLCQAQQPAAAPTANSGIKLDQSPLFNAADTNKDGKLSKTEWAAVKGAEPLFNAMDKDKDELLTLAELNASSPPDVADTNKDGKLSVEEFQASLVQAELPLLPTNEVNSVKPSQVMTRLIVLNPSHEEHTQ